MSCLFVNKLFCPLLLLHVSSAAPFIFSRLWFLRMNFCELMEFHSFFFLKWRHFGGKKHVQWKSVFICPFFIVFLFHLHVRFIICHVRSKLLSPFSFLYSFVMQKFVRLSGLLPSHRRAAFSLQI